MVGQQRLRENLASVRVIDTAAVDGDDRGVDRQLAEDGPQRTAGASGTQGKDAALFDKLVDCPNVRLRDFG